VGRLPIHFILASRCVRVEMKKGSDFPVPRARASLLGNPASKQKKVKFPSTLKKGQNIDTKMRVRCFRDIPSMNRKLSPTFALPSRCVRQIFLRHGAYLANASSCQAQSRISCEEWAWKQLLHTKLKNFFFLNRFAS